MKDDIESIRDTVLKIVSEKPYTRDSYWKLYFEVLLELGICKTSKNSGYFIPYKHLNDLINPETVTRAYRKIKEENPALAPTPKVQQHREENEDEMKAINLWWQPTRLRATGEQTILFEGDDIC